MGGWLAEQGFEIALAHDQSTAQHHLANEPIDVALVDLRLGSEDGFALGSDEGSLDGAILG